ncbi:MAG: hypothetical protein R6V45_14215 [Oceanipulchritudo sp.]
MQQLLQQGKEEARELFEGFVTTATYFLWFIEEFCGTGFLCMPHE